MHPLLLCRQEKGQRKYCRERALNNNKRRDCLRLGGGGGGGGGGGENPTLESAGKKTNLPYALSKYCIRHLKNPDFAQKTGTGRQQRDGPLMEL